MREFSNFYLPTQYFSEVCRVCLSKHNVLVSIEEINFTHNLKPNGYSETVKLKSVFQKFCGVEIDVSDSKPQKICEFCINMGCKAFNFFQLFLYSNLLLDKKLEEIKLSLEESQANKNNEENAGVVTQTNKCLENASSSTVMAVKTEYDSDCHDNNVSDFELTEAKSPALSSQCPKSTEAKKQQSIDFKNTGVDAILPSQDIKNTNTQKIKRKYSRRILSPEKSLEVYKNIDPIKANALKILLHIKSKILPEVPGKKSPEKKTPTAMLRKIAHQNELFTCKICKKLFNDIYKVIEHLKNDHPDVKSCLLCPIKFNKVQYLYYHLAAHSPKGFVCRSCRLYFENQKDLDDHMEIVDHSDRKKCPKCQKTFRVPCMVRYHLETVHFQKQKYQCKTCGKMFKYRGSMRRHENSAHGIRKRFLCQICGQGFTTHYIMKIHVQTVHKVNQGVVKKDYSKTRVRHCNTSGASGPNKMKFDCKFCTKKFSWLHTFLSHCKIHPEFKEYLCAMCGSVFETRKEYVNHYNTHKKFPCQGCDKMFPTMRAAYVHKYTHKPYGKKTVRCSVCHRSFKHKHLLDSHMNVHTGQRPFKCEKCGKCFKQSSHLRVHLVSLHGGKKQWSCKLCDKAFSFQYGIKAHMRTHTGEKPFPCPFCEKKFRDTVSRHKHVKKDHPKKVDEFLIYKKKYQEEENRRIETLEREENNETDLDDGSDDQS